MIPIPHDHARPSRRGPGTGVASPMGHRGAPAILSAPTVSRHRVSSGVRQKGTLACRRQTDIRCEVTRVRFSKLS